MQTGESSPSVIHLKNTGGPDARKGIRARFTSCRSHLKRQEETLVSFDWDSNPELPQLLDDCLVWNPHYRSGVYQDWEDCRSAKLLTPKVICYSRIANIE